MQTHKLLIAASTIIILSGCTGATTEPVAIAEAEEVEVVEEPEPTPEPEPEPEPEPKPEPKAPPGTYGSDPTLDRLQNLCEAGDIDACDELYWDSPLNSEYEAFALDRLDELDEPTFDTTSDDFVSVMFEMSWNQMSATQQVDICYAYTVLPKSMSYESYVDGYGADAPSQRQFETFFDSKC